MARERMTVLQRISDLQQGWPEVGRRICPEVLLLYRARDLLYEDLEQVLRPLQLLPSDLDVLAVLRTAPAPHQATPTAVAAALLLSSGGLTKILHRLEGMQLIARPPNPRDRRSRMVQLSADGVALLDRAAEVVLAHQQRCLSGLDPAEQRQLQGLLDKLVGSLEGPAAT
jgi:DNA-binding MarR family transcriptional regulator